MLDWRRISSDPTNRDATRLMDEFFRSVTRVEPVSRLEMVLDFCRGREVLDIGAGEHDISFYSEEGWEHGLIKRVASRTVAVEINPDLCVHYNAKGFDFRCVDATSDVDLGERFERIFVGDVIEHVNDPVRLLAFAKRHLAENGTILLTTPNPFAPRFRHHRARRKTAYIMANLEHTRWVSTSNLHELALRAGLSLKAIRWPLWKRRPRRPMDLIATALKRALLMVRPLEDVFHEYAFELVATPGQIVTQQAEASPPPR